MLYDAFDGLIPKKLYFNRGGPTTFFRYLFREAKIA